MFQNAMWIGRGIETYRDEENNKSLLLRKAFCHKEEIEKAELMVCGLGLGVYTINGKAVTDEVLSTPYTYYDKRVVYRCFDVTQLVRQGDNAVGVHLGNGFYFSNMTVWDEHAAVYRHEPKLLCCLRITDKEGNVKNIVSDRSWKCTVGPCVYNQMRQGERYDARLLPVGFDTPEYIEGEQWKNAVQVTEPGGDLEPMDAPPIRVIRTLTAKKVAENIYDCGENIAGRAKITVTGAPGQEILIQYDELKMQGEICIDDNTALAEDRNKKTMTYRRNWAAFCYEENAPLKHQCIFVCSGRKKEVFAPEFTYYGFRYLYIENAPEDFQVEVEVIHSDLKTVGSFTCDADMLNRIHRASVRSFQSNHVGIPTDCPHREQCGWTGDNMIACGAAIMNFDMGDFYRKWMRDFQDVQRKNGALPGIVPYSGGGWGTRFYSGTAWSGALIEIPWRIYLTTGRTDLMALVWENMCRYIFMVERTSENYIYSFGYPDWCPPKGQPTCPKAVHLTAICYHLAYVMGEMAKVLGEDASVFETMAGRYRKAWRDTFLGDESLKQYQTYFACALYYDLLEEDEKPAFAAELAQLTEKMGYHFNSGMQGTQYMFDALSLNGYGDVIFRCVTNPQFPSYAYWMNSGLTTLAENWDMCSSLNHQMYGEVDAWLYRHIGGIQFTQKGLRIAPLLLPEVGNFKVTHGEISVERKGSTLTVCLPCVADLEIPGVKTRLQPGVYTYKI